MTSVRRCAGCGADNDPDEVFCTACHEFLSWQSVERVAQDVQPDGATAVDAVVDSIDASAEIAVELGRRDLAVHLQQAKHRLEQQSLPVVVAGEFKGGKSTLVNALLQYDVCPVDADIVTAVPTTVTWAEQPRVVSMIRTADGETNSTREVAVADIRRLVTEKADPADPERLRGVEIGLPHRLLRTGIDLVDTPGVGGLDSAHGFLTLNALRQARATLFVTDASQELSGPELNFLITAARRCPATALVVTKIDLHLEWRRIVDLDRGHLARAGLDVPVFGVSSLLRLAAVDDPSLDEESGFADLFTFLADQVVLRGRESAATVAAQEVEYVSTQLESELQVEQAVVSAPETKAEVVRELQHAQHQATRLRRENASWQQMLADGIADLVSDVEHDLQGRLRGLVRDAEEMIDQTDPRVTWTDTEAWLRRRVAVLTMANRDRLGQHAEELAASVAEEFNLQAGTVIALRWTATDDQTEAVPLQAAAGFSPGGRLVPFLAAARSSYYLPMMVGSLAVSVFTVTGPIHLAIIGASALLGTGIGSKIIKDERRRQVVHRQQQAKAAMRKYVEEVAFLMNKQTHDQLRSAQRDLRDDFQARAAQLERSAVRALRRVEDLDQLDPADRADRRRRLADEQRRLSEARVGARELLERAS